MAVEWCPIRQEGGEDPTGHCVHQCCAVRVRQGFRMAAWHSCEKHFSTFARERKGTNGYYYNIMLYFMLFCVCEFHLGLLDKGRQHIFDLRFTPILFLRPQ